MKTYVTLCLMTILLSTMNAFAQAPSKTRRSTPQPNISRPVDFAEFVGMWEYAPDSLQKMYFTVKEEQPGRFKFVEGFEYNGKITWAKTMVNHADGIYLKPLNGKLAGRFTSPNFRATHGHDITYRITLSLEPNGKLLYAVSSELEPERYHATKVNNGEDVGEVITSSSKVTVASDFLSQLDNAMARALTLGKLTVVDGYALQNWSDENMGGQALLRFSPSSGTWVLVSMGGGAWDADSLAAEGVPRAVAALLVKRSLEPPPPRHPRRRRT
jgi:hypothetical protein